MLFINTRPTVRALSLTQALQAKKIAVLDLPLLAITEQPITQSKQKTLTTLSSHSTNIPQVLVVVSPSAAEIGCQFLLQHGISMSDSIKVVAVGQRTADILLQHGISSIVPHTASNEAMLELDCLQKLIKPTITDNTYNAYIDSNQPIMVWRGRGGRRLLIDTLREHGVIVDVIEWYKRYFPQTSTRVWQQWLMKQNRATSLATEETVITTKTIEPLIVLITSAESFHHWKMLLASTETTHYLGKITYLVLGQRLSRILIHEGCKYQTIDDLRARTIINQLTNK